MINKRRRFYKLPTGNLGADNAQRYDIAINELIKNQNKMKTIVQEQIAILKKSSQNFKDLFKILQTTRAYWLQEFLLLKQL